MRIREDLSANDINYLSLLTEEEALDFLKSGVSTILRLTSRDFYEISSVEEFQSKVMEHERGAYEYFQIYIE